MMKSMLLPMAALMLATASAPSLAVPVTYQLDPDHTHPEFEVDHFGGLSTWRGIFKSTSGTVVLDREQGTGTVNVTIQTASIDFAMDALNKHVSGPDMLDAERFPTATYTGTLSDFVAGAPTAVHGQLTLHGVTRPVDLKIDSFKCIMHPMKKVEVCGADATGHFNRAEFGVDYGQKLGFNQDVALRIQVEGSKVP